MSSAETPRFDASAAAQQMLELGQAASVPTVLPTQAHSSPGAPPSWASPAPLPGSLSDRGNAKLFVRLYRNDYRHVPGIGWFRWDGKVWDACSEDRVVDEVHRFVKQILRTSVTASDRSGPCRSRRSRSRTAIARRA